MKNRKLFIVGECSLGFVIRPRDGLDNRRWYFESWLDAESHADYLERNETGLVGLPGNGGHSTRGEI